MPASEIWLIRHGESTWNAAGRWQGQADPPLSERGRKQARAAAARLVEAKLAALVTSDLVRAAETAALLGAALGLEPDADPRLRELDVGAWSGLTHLEIRRAWPEAYRRVRAGDTDLAVGGGESRRALAARVDPVIEEIAGRHPGRRVGVVTHGGVIRGLVRGSRPTNLEVVRLRVTSG